MLKVKFRKPDLIGWVAITLLLLLAVGWVAPQNLPVVLYKVCLMTLAFVLGYWLSSALLKMTGSIDDGVEALVRVIIIAAVMIGMALGL